MLVVSISDPPEGFTMTVRDLTTGRTGYMTASAANGFMNTNIADCSGTPYTFHAEYSSAIAAERGAVGRARGRRADGAGDRARRGVQLGDQQGPVQRAFPGGQSYYRPEHL